MPLKVCAEADSTGKVDYPAEYEAILYDSYDGLVSAEINAVAQTNDGYIWVGTYSGLYRYDGHQFEKIDLDPKICNVMALYVDSRGWLWIGTNDSGLACFDPKEKTIRFHTVQDGLSAYSIRALCEDGDGNIYVGTVSYLSVIRADGSVHTFDEWNAISGIRSLSYIEDGVIAGVTNSGELFFTDGNELLYERTFDEDGVYYTTISRGSKDDLVAGTSEPMLERLVWDGTEAAVTGIIDTGNVAYYNDILYDEKTDGYFFCAENGMGVLSGADNEITYLMRDGFDSSVSGVIEDYQGNIWFVSNKQGIIEYSPNPFMDVFVKASL